MTLRCEQITFAYPLENPCCGTSAWNCSLDGFSACSGPTARGRVRSCDVLTARSGRSPAGLPG